MPEEKTKTPNIKVQNAKLGVFIPSLHSGRLAPIKRFGLVFRVHS